MSNSFCNSQASIVANGDVSSSSGVTLSAGGAFDISQLQAFDNSDNNVPATAQVKSISGAGDVYLGSNILDVTVARGQTRPSAASSTTAARPGASVKA